MAEIEILRRIRPELRWTPMAGTQTLGLRDRKIAEIGNATEVDRAVLEAQTVLGRCTPPNAPQGSETGLVVGYVQSGKTLSFTTVMALARDNNFQLIILIAGIGVNLKSQSERRLLRDLGIDAGVRGWAHFENPDAQRTAANIGNALATWRQPGIPAHRQRAVVITVLKNATRLRNLVATLRRLDLSNVPALVIDDEADQASLNNMAADNRRTGQNRRSPTYDWITQIKAALPHHTLLQYTATPQAPFLISLADVLSPSFAELVTPGDDYVGGRQFFSGNASLTAIIPPGEIPSATNVLNAAPPTLLRALRLFLLGAAAHYLRDQRGNRSMMIHPSQATAPHANYMQWATRAITGWRALLGQPRASAAYRECVRLFQPEYRSLVTTQPDLAPFEQLIEAIPMVIGETRVLQVNSTRQGERDVKWSETDYWILIGGQKLDRGFTVEGLTITYMPRSLGTGRADTVQQRARFYGYKRSYEGLCRVFLAGDVHAALHEYVEHEEFVRAALRRFRGRPLRDWRRDFLLTGRLTPTRPSVVGVEYTHVRLDSGWAYPGHLHKSPSDIGANRDLTREAAARWAADFGSADAASHAAFKDNRADSPRNVMIESVPLALVLREYLAEVAVRDYDDSVEHTGLIIALEHRLGRSPEEVCDVFLIGNLESQTRSQTSTGRINQLFMGKSPNTNDFSRLVYVGDQALKHERRICVHLRTFSLRETPTGPITAPDVSWFAVYVPQPLRKEVVVEKERRRGRP